MGYRVCVLEPDKNAPAAIVAEKHICAPYTDEAALTELASLCKTVTTEFENVPAAALEFLASKGAETCPAANAVRITQDRFDEKSFIKSAGAPVAPHLLIESDEDLKKASAPYFPAILKTARLGYDGKGQITVNDRRELAIAFEKLGKVRCVLEKRLPLFKEVSVIAARNSKGEVAVFPVSENYHRKGILAVSVMPARLDEEISDRAREIASKIIEKLDYVGVLCTELFVLSDGRLVVNELAPPRLMPASAASTNNRFAPWPIFRSAIRLRFLSPSCSTCSAIFGSMKTKTSASRTGVRCWTSRVSNCICTARSSRGTHVKWATSLV